MIDTKSIVWIGTNEVAEMIGVQPGTIIQWCREKRFPQPVRFSRRVLKWDRHEVTKHIESMPRGVELIEPPFLESQHDD